MPRRPLQAARPVLPALAGGAGVAVLVLLFFGVGISSIARFAGYEAAFVVAPGLALFGALARRKPRLLEWAAIGVPLGYAIEILAFMGFSATGARWAFWLYPGLALLAAAIIARHRGGWPEASVSPSARNPAMAATVITAVGLLLLAFGTWTQTPFPGHFGDVALSPDQTYYLSLASDAEQHWPISSPQVSDTPYGAYTFAFAHFGAVGSITHVDMAHLVFRLYLVSLYAAAALLLSFLGRLAGVGRWAGPLAVGLFFLTGELDLSPFQAVPLGDSRMIDFQQDPTWGYSLLFFGGSLALVAEAVRSSERLCLGRWAVLTVLLIAMAGTKSAPIPVLIGGFGLLFAARTLRERRIAWREGLYVGAAVCAAVFGSIFYGGQSDLVSLDPLTLTKEMRPIDLFSGEISGGLSRALFWGAAVPLSTIALFAAPMFGLGLLAVLRRMRLTRTQGLLAGTFAISLIPYFFMSTILGGLASIASYGQACLAAVGGAGLELGYLKVSERRPRAGTALALGLAIWLLLLLASSLIPYYVLGWSEVRLYRLWYLVPAVGFVAGLVALMLLPKVRLVLGTTVVLAFLAYAVLDLPVDGLAPVVERKTTHHPAYTRSTNTLQGITRGVMDGVLWVRHHSRSRDVLAVNNQYLDDAQTDARYFYYSAFSYRRVFLEGWDYTLAAHDIQAQAGQANTPRESHPFPKRLRLNDLAFAGNRLALHVLRDRYRVRYLLVDLNLGSTSPELRRLAKPLFANRSVQIYGTKELLAVRSGGRASNRSTTRIVESMTRSTS